MNDHGFDGNWQLHCMLDNGVEMRFSTTVDSTELCWGKVVQITEGKGGRPRLVKKCSSIHSFNFLLSCSFNGLYGLKRQVLFLNVSQTRERHQLAECRV